MLNYLHTIKIEYTLLQNTKIENTLLFLVSASVIFVRSVFSSNHKAKLSKNKSDAAAQ